MCIVSGVHNSQQLCNSMLLHRKPIRASNIEKRKCTRTKQKERKKSEKERAVINPYSIEILNIVFCYIQICFHSISCSNIICLELLLHLHTVTLRNTILTHWHLRDGKNPMCSVLRGLRMQSVLNAEAVNPFAT